MIRFIKIYATDILRWLYWGPLRVIVPLLPRRFSYTAVWPAALARCLLSRRKTALIRAWLESVTGRRASFSEALEVFLQSYRGSIDALLYGKLSAENIDRFVDYEGLENLSSALKLGKGAILLHLHFGNEEYIMPAVGHKGFAVSQLASRWEPEYLPGALFSLSNAIKRYAWRLRIGTREKLPVGFVYIDDGLRNAFRALVRGELLLLAVDGREGSRWMELPFLGLTAIISPGPMKMARSTGAPVLPVLIKRVGLWRQKLVVLPPIPFSVGSEVEQENIRRDTLAALSALEPLVAEEPAQYAKFILQGVSLFKEEEAHR